MNLLFQFKTQLSSLVGIIIAILGLALFPASDLKPVFIIQIIALLIVSVINFIWIIRPIQIIRSQLDKINQGYLNSQPLFQGNDDIGMISRRVNQLRVTLRTISVEIVGTAEAINTLTSDLESTTRNMGQSISEAKNKTNTITSTSKDISTNMNTVAVSAEQAAANVSSISNTIEQFSVNMNTVAAAAGEASANMNDISGNVSNISKEINGITASIESMSEALNNINKNTSDVTQYSEETSSGVAETLDSMNELAEVTQEISKILKLVNDIASQTNMLALNATIEAASAGEAGKGFAVVAGEIKELAKQTADANAEIARQIQQVQENVSVSQNHVQKISGVFTQVLKLNQGIASLVEEQTNQSVQLVDAIDSVAAAAKSSALNIEEAASGIQEITRSTAEAFKGSKETARNVSETSIGVKEIAQSSVQSARIINDISTNIQSINAEINDVADSINQNIHGVTEFVELTSNLEKSASFFTDNSDVVFFWTERLSVQNKAIDQQHKDIVDQINDIFRQVKQNSDKANTLALLDRLYDSAKEHFALEQEAFGPTEYPEKEKHEGIHAEILETLRKHIDDCQASDADNSQDILDFIKSWLLTHILTVDKKYSPYI